MSIFKVIDPKSYFFFIVFSVHNESRGKFDVPIIIMTIQFF